VPVRIDPDTGLLAREDAAEAYEDVFRRGTEPTKFAEKAVRPPAFELLDQGGADVTLIQKKQVEVED
jgi:hypothetical protein